MASVPHSQSDMNRPAELDDRLSFIGLDESARVRLRELKPLLDTAIEPALAKFYARIAGLPEMKRFFPDSQSTASAKSRQKQHWRTIADAAFNENYMQGVRRIGDVHARIGLEPRWYVGGYALILEQLIRSVVQQRWPKFSLGKRGSEDLAELLGALVKATMLDIELSISMYIEQRDQEVARAAEQQRIADENRAQAIRVMSDALAHLAQGDLMCRIDDAVASEYEGLKKDFNRTVAGLREAFAALAMSITTIEQTTNEIATAAEDLSRRTESQAAGLEQTSAALTEISGAVSSTVEHTRNANGIVAATRSEAEKGGGVVQKAIDAMGRIQKSSKDIGQIIGVIDEIAFQTNLLALNAGVEAARAGDSGRGFAVVASEVRALAQRSADAAKEIKTLISTAGSEVDQGVELVAETGRALKSIVSQVAKVSDVMGSIDNSAKEQAISIQQVSSAVQQMDQATQQNAAMVEETTAATRSLHQETEQLSQSVAKFRVNDTGPARGERPMLRAANM